MTAYYNEFDPFAAAWLRQLIAEGHIAPGVVDERSIMDVVPSDLEDFTQCHFFAGIGVWSYALRRAGWSDDRPIWTGSCPCQPFSDAGKGGGFADERHLWPGFFHLIEQCDPAVVIGEQVASKDGLAWLDLVRSDMEGTSRSFAAADLCAAGVGAPHIRQRLWWVGLADATSRGLGIVGNAAFPGGSGYSDSRIEPDRLADAEHNDGRADEPRGRPDRRTVDGGGGEPLRLDDDDDARPQGFAGHGDDGDQPGRLDTVADGHVATASASGGLADSVCDGAESVARNGIVPQGTIDRDDGRASRSGVAVGNGGASGGMEIATSERLQGLDCLSQNEQTAGSRLLPAGSGGAIPKRLVRIERPGPVNGFWRDADWLFCRDGRWRPVESGTFPLVNGATDHMVRGGDTSESLDASSTTEARTGRLKGYGNAINAEAAQAFIETVMSLVA